MATFYGYDDYNEKVWWFVAYLNWAAALSRYPTLKASKSDYVTKQANDLLNIREEVNVKSYDKTQTRV